MTEKIQVTEAQFEALMKVHQQANFLAGNARNLAKDAEATLSSLALGVSALRPEPSDALRLLEGRGQAGGLLRDGSPAPSRRGTGGPELGGRGSHGQRHQLVALGHLHPQGGGGGGLITANGGGWHLITLPHARTLDLEAQEGHELNGR